MSKPIGANIYKSKVEEIHSFDGYYKSVFFRNNNLVIPYINLGISNHAISIENNLRYLDFSYMIFEGISYLDVYINNRRLIIYNGLKSNDLFHFGGAYLDYETHVFNDMEISCNNAYLQTLELTHLSDDMWIPIILPNASSNMDSNTVSHFFNGKYMPDDIKVLIQ